MKDLPALQDFDFTVDVRVGQIDFRNYQELLAQATTLADWLAQVTLSEDNLAEGKRLVASVRKKVNELKDFKKSVRQSYMRPLNDLSDRIDAINEVVTKAEDTVRSQIRELEERRRAQKAEEIRRIWDLRRGQYPEIPSEALRFEDFMQPKYCNKTWPMSGVESDMVAHFERVKKDLEFIRRLDPDGDAVETYREAGGDVTNVVPRPKREPVRDGWALRILNASDLEKACAALDRESIPYERFFVNRLGDD